MRMEFLFILLLISAFSFAQKVVSGTVSDENGNFQAQVLVLNSNKNTSVFSDSNGNFSINADEKDELRFVKDGFYRNDLKITATDFSKSQQIILKPVEILIPEVELNYIPTGNLEKDAQNVGISKRVSALNSKMEEYLKSPMTETVPQNTTPKSFQPHDFKEGQMDLMGVADAIGKLLTKKTTKANYYEARDFIARIKSEIDLSYFRKFGMQDEGIDRFLLYAEDIFMLSKKYRKKFNKVKIYNDLLSAFGEYRKTNDLEF